MKFLIVDSNSILNRAFYGIKLLSTKNGEYTNAVYGFFNIVLKLMDDLAPEEAVFAFDLPAPTFRHKLYDGYKAQRKGMPPELGQQLPVVKELITALGWPVVECEGYEADDILGTLAKGVEEQGGDSLLLTGDRDSLQLVDEHTTVILAATRAGGAQYLTMDPAAVKEKYGVEPLQLIETKALMGDSSDNIPGVAGIGEKTAFSLIQKYGSVERIYQDVEGLEVPAGVKKKLLAGEEMARLSRKLGIICREAPISVKAEDYRRAPMDEGRLCAIPYGPAEAGPQRCSPGPGGYSGGQGGGVRPAFCPPGPWEAGRPGGPHRHRRGLEGGAAGKAGGSQGGQALACPGAWGGAAGRAKRPSR